jgi:serine/threonine protein kinase
MLSGSPPFAGSNAAQIALEVAMQRQPPQLPRQAHSSPALAQLLRACFAYEPAGRPSAAEVLQLLEHVAAEGCSGAAASMQGSSSVAAIAG